MCNSHKIPHPRKNFYHRSWCAVALLLLVFFAPSPAMASGWHLLHEEDFAYKFLLMIVGQPINYFAAPSPVIDGDNPEVIFGALSMYWNSFLMTLSAILVLVAFFTTSLSGAGNKEGKIEGAAKHAPAKAVLTLVGLTPIISGFSLAQIAALGMTSYGIMAANQLATTGVNHVLKGGAMFGKAKTIGELLPSNTSPLVEAGSKLGVCHAVIESMEVNIDMADSFEDRNSGLKGIIKHVTGGPNPSVQSLGQVFSLFALPTGPTDDIGAADGYIYTIAPNFNTASYVDKSSGIMSFFQSSPTTDKESPLLKETIKMETSHGDIYVHRKPILDRWESNAEISRWIGSKHARGSNFIKKNLWVSPDDSACGYFGISPDRVSLANFDELTSLEGMFQISKEDIKNITAEALEDYSKAQDKYIDEYNNTANFLIRRSWELAYNSALVQNWPGSKLDDAFLKDVHRDAKEAADADWDSMSDEMKETTNKDKLIQESMAESLHSLCGFPRGLPAEAKVFARTGKISDGCSGNVSKDGSEDPPKWSTQFDTLLKAITEEGTIRALRLKKRHDEMVAAFLRPVAAANSTLDPRDINNPGDAQPNPFRLNELTQVARDPDNNPIFAFGLGAWYWKLPQFAQAVQSVPQSQPVTIFEQAANDQEIAELVKTGVRFSLEDIKDAPATPVQTVEEFTEFSYNMLRGGELFSKRIMFGDEVSFDSSDIEPTASDTRVDYPCPTTFSFSASYCWISQGISGALNLIPSIYQGILTRTIDGFKYITADQTETDPLMATSLWLQEIFSMIETAILVLFALWAGLKIIAKMSDQSIEAAGRIKWVGAIVSAAMIIPNGIKSIAKQRLNQMMTIILSQLLVFAGAIAYTAYMLPAIPFIYFNFAVLTYFMLIMESLVATPLWAAAHSIPAGQGGFTGHARSGYMIMLNLSVRPVLLVFGFFTSILLLRVSITYTIYLFEPMLAGLQLSGGAANATTAFLPFFATIIILIGVLIQTTHKSFAVISEMQDQVMRYVGGSQLANDKGDVEAAVGKSKGAASMGYKAGQDAKKKLDDQKAAEKSKKKEADEKAWRDRNDNGGGGYSSASAKGKANDQLNQTDAKDK